MSYNLENDMLSINDLADTGKSGGFKYELSDENYDAQIVGVVTKMSKYQETGKEYRSYTLVFQIKDDKGNPVYVGSKNLTPSLASKSSLYAYMKGWLKQSDPVAITEALKKAGIASDKGFSFTGFIGKQCKITINMTPSKKDPTKLNPVVAAILPAKKDTAYTAVKANLSTGSIFMYEIDGSKFLDVVTVVEMKKKEKASDVKTVAKESAPAQQSTSDNTDLEVDDSENELPF